MTVRHYAITFVIDNGDDEHAPAAIVDALDSLQASGAFTKLLIDEMERTACCVCLVQNILITPPDDANAAPNRIADEIEGRR